MKKRFEGLPEYQKNAEIFEASQFTNEKKFIKIKKTRYKQRRFVQKI